MTSAQCSVDCVSFGVGFRLIADTDLLLAKMRQCAPLGTQVGGATTKEAKRFALLSVCGVDSYSLIIDGKIVGESAMLQPLLDQLASDLMVYVANDAPDRVFVHAGVVGWQGHALVFPGSSFAGKTTLVAELVRAGAVYYSDEYAVIDEHGQVHPYARDLQMRNVGCEGQRSVAVALLNGVAGTVPLRVSHIVFAEFVEAGLWNSQPMSPGIAVLEMLRHAIPVQRTPARVMATLATMMETATAARSERGEASDAARWLLDAMTADRESR